MNIQTNRLRHYVHHHTGGLEILVDWRELEAKVHHHTGGLEMS